MVTEKKMTVTMAMDEWTAENLAMALLGDVSTDTNGKKVTNIFSRNTFEGELKFEGTNEVGPQMDIDLSRVVYKPSKSLNPISDKWETSRSRTRLWPTTSVSSAPGRCESRLPLALALADRDFLLCVDGLGSFGNQDAQHAFVKVGCDFLLVGAIREAERPLEGTAGTVDQGREEIRAGREEGYLLGAECMRQATRKMTDTREVEAIGPRSLPGRPTQQAA